MIKPSLTTPKLFSSSRTMSGRSTTVVLPLLRKASTTAPSPTTRIRLQPGFAEAYVNRGAAYKEKGDPDRADADDAKARDLMPGK